MTVSEVETLPRVHVLPPSTVFASEPFEPGANATPEGPAIIAP